MKRKLYVEIPTNKVGNIILASDNRPATKKEVDAVKAKHKKGRCDHGVFYDEPGWMYDLRLCGVCGAGLGLI